MAPKACTRRTKSLLALPLALALALALAAALAACASASGTSAGAARPAAASGGGGTASGSTGSGGAAPGSGTATGSGGGGGAASDRAGAAANVPVAARTLICPQVGYGGAVVRPPLDQAIPAGFQAVAVVQCIPVSVMIPVAEPDPYVRKEVAIAGLGPLLAALREPSDLRIDVLRRCMVPATMMPQLALVGSDGAVIYPRIPVNVCGAPIPQVAASLAALHWIVLSAAIEPLCCDKILRTGLPRVPQTAVRPAS
jgi:hypothetical protein